MKTAYSNKEWFEIPGFDGIYEINVDGQVRTWRKHGKKERSDKPTIMKPSTRGKSRSRYVTLRKDNGEMFDISICRLMAIVFLGGIRDNEIAYCVDGDNGNTHLHNIGIIEKREMCAMLGKRTNAKSIFKVDKSGNVIELYKSEKEAATKNFLSRSQIAKHLKGKVKNPFKYLDYTFVYEG